MERWLGVRVLITGGRGLIGTVLRDRLPFSVTPFDLPESDATDLTQLTTALEGHDALIHLAWNTQVEHYKSEQIHPPNLLMAYNAYNAAIGCGVRRVVVASSVHADEYASHTPGDGTMDPHRLPTPDSPYGASKCMAEALARMYATGAFWRWSASDLVA